MFFPPENRYIFWYATPKVYIISGMSFLGSFSLESIAVLELRNICGRTPCGELMVDGVLVLSSLSVTCTNLPFGRSFDGNAETARTLSFRVVLPRCRLEEMRLIISERGRVFITCFRRQRIDGISIGRLYDYRRWCGPVRIGSGDWSTVVVYVALTTECDNVPSAPGAFLWPLASAVISRM